MSGCGYGARPGCSGTLCRSARPCLRRLAICRYPLGTDGLPDLSAEGQTGWICALISRLPAGEGALDLPGAPGAGERPVRATCAAGSLVPPLAAGDRVSLEGRTWRVSSICRDRHVSAELLPVAQGGGA